MIALDLQPFPIIEDIGFQKMSQHIEMRWSLPSRKFLFTIAFCSGVELGPVNPQKQDLRKDAGGGMVVNLTASIKNKLLIFKILSPVKCCHSLK